MSARVRSRSRGRGDGQESSDTAETVAARKLGGKKSQRKESPTKNVDMEPGQEKEGGASVVQEPELEGPSQEMDVEKVEGEPGDDPDVEGKIPPNVVPAEIPEGGDGQ
ncbi:P antigen family member 4 [Moschus berezovskii]|uniref:P antigen family member 4 n=1 Tax=Moschus berezovskii TaxID=68408 RepID=UPI002444B760|nr:P antigen family member 4 [Moschus berezovskii]XP_055249784.1 P antigen family member 4 [Moschus berezovskii]